MRNLSRTMIGLALGAAMLTPIAAQAQERDRGDQAVNRQRGGQDRGNENRGNPNRGGQDRGAMMNGDARREAAAQGREAARTVERPAPIERAAPMERQAPVARVDNGGGGRQWSGADRNRGNQGDRNWGQRNDGVMRSVDANRVGNDRRDWNGNSGRNDNRDRADNRNDRDRNWNRNDGNRSWASDRRDWNGNNWDRRDNRNWDNRWRNDRRYGWQDYRNHNRNIYRLPRYEGRYGYNYRRWYPGYRFDPFYYSSSYWIDDPYYYRLPPAYGDYRWVRYYDDAALVDIRTGLIVDIIYSIFL